LNESQLPEDDLDRLILAFLDCRLRCRQSLLPTFQFSRHQVGLGMSEGFAASERRPPERAEKVI